MNNLTPHQKARIRKLIQVKGARHNKHPRHLHVINSTDSKPFEVAAPFYSSFNNFNLKQKNPARVYSRLGGSIGIGSYDDSEEADFSGMGAGTDQSMITTTPWYEQFGKAVSSVFTPNNVQAYALYKLELQRNKLNLQRAKVGLPPLDMPTATVGLAPDTKKMVYFGIAAIAAVILIPKLVR